MQWAVGEEAYARRNPQVGLQTFQLFSGTFSAAGDFLTSQFLFSTNITFPTAVQFGLSGLGAFGLFRRKRKA